MASLMLRSVYAKRAIMNQTLVKVSATGLKGELSFAFFCFLQMTALRAMSSVPHHGNVNPHGWKSWKDIPDSALPPCPDPSNGLYETNVYKKLQKKRIWYQVSVTVLFTNYLSNKTY